MENNKFEIDALSLIALDAVLNAFDEEVHLHKIQNFIPNNIIEEKVYKLLLQLPYDFSYYFYLSINKIQYYNSVKKIFNDLDLLDEIIFYDLSIIVLLREKINHSFEENFAIINSLRELMPNYFKLIDKYGKFYDTLTMTFSNKLIDLKDVAKFIEALFSLDFSKRLKSIRKSISNSIPELEEFNNILDCVKKQILNKTNIFLEDEIIIDSSEIHIFSIYPNFIFFNKFFTRENISTLFLLEKVKNSNKNFDLQFFNSFYLIKYIYDMDKLWKDNFLDQALFEKYIGLIKYSSSSLSLLPDKFRYKFIKDFNKNKLDKPLYKIHLKKYLDFEKKYKNLDELEEKFRIFIFKIAEEMANMPQLKILLPRPDAKEEIKTLSQKIYNILNNKD